MPTNFDRLGERGLAAFPPSPFWELVGLRLTNLAPGEATFELDVMPRLANIQGLLHGGALSTLADTTMGAACWTLAEAGRVFTTVDLKMTFLKAVRSGVLKAAGTIIRAGRSAAFAECSITDSDGLLVARASCTFLFQPA